MVACCSFYLGPTVEAQVEDNASAADVLREVVGTYEKLSTYQDTGNLTEISFPESSTGNSTMVIAFATQFHRGGDYSFVWATTEYFAGKQISKSENRFWSDDLKGWWSESFEGRKAKVKEMTFAEATASATGISRGASLDIFRLLSSNIPGFRVDDFENMRITGSEKIGGVDSYILTGNRPKFPTMKCEVWVGKKDHLIRKWVEVDPYHHATTTTIRTDLIAETSAP
jgi:hypothetical protein